MANERLKRARNALCADNGRGARVIPPPFSAQELYQLLIPEKRKSE